MSQHVLYFVGGPFDLTKRMMPGASPPGAYVDMAAVENLTPNWRVQGDVAIDFAHHRYRVCYGNHEQYPFYICVYEGKH
jgi:hypothetical protein